MAVTAASLRTSIRMEVEASEPRNRPYETVLTNAPGTSGTTFGVADGDAFQVGDLVEGPGGELALVTAISTNDLTVKRSARSVAAENLGAGDIVKKNPRFSIEQIDNALSNILVELNPRVHALLTEDITKTTDDFYDVTDVLMEEVYSTWYIDDGSIFTPFFLFQTDPANSQPKVWLSAHRYTGTVHIVYRRPYAAVTELPDRLVPMMVSGAVYKLLGGAAVMATDDPGNRTDRTVQGGQESRDSYWFFREFTRLRDAEVVYLASQIRKIPADRRSQRARRYVK